MEMEFKVGDKVKIPKTKTADNFIKLENSTAILEAKKIKQDFLYVSGTGNTGDTYKLGITSNVWNSTFHENDLEYYEEPKQQNMKNKQTIITIEIAKKLYQGSDQTLKDWALLNFTKEELEANELPKSWEELKVVSGYYYNDSEMMDGQDFLELVETKKCKTNVKTNKLVFPTRPLAEASLALSQLLQLRNAWWGDWLPYTPKNTNERKYSIWYDQSDKDFIVNTVFAFNRIFVFETEELAKEFLTEFEELLIIARELI